jgi:CHAD domain-containing protein
LFFVRFNFPEAKQFMKIRRYLKDVFYADQASTFLQRIIQQRQGAAERRHGEALHDWRVLVRRLIEFTRLWAPKALRQQVLPIARPWIEATNAARDGEVELELLAALRQENDKAWAADLARLEESSAAACHAEIAKLTAYLAEPARRAEEHKLADLLAPLPRYPVAPPRLAQRFKKAIANFEHLQNVDERDLAALHALRLATKRLRYGFEPLTAYESELKPVLAELTALQRALGEHRDWQRLAEKARQAGAAPKLVQEMEQRGEKSLAARPRKLKETEAWLDQGWTPPAPPWRLLRRRLLAHFRKEDQAPIEQALKLAGKAARDHKRTNGNGALVHPLRTALSLLEEGGVKEQKVILAALLGEALTESPAVGEDALGGEFGKEIVGAALALGPEPETPQEQAGRVQAAPAWVRLVALAQELERLRHAAELSRPRKAAREVSERIAALRPVFQELRLAGARQLMKQLETLMQYLE